MNRKIRAIFADYDGTLCPTTALRSASVSFIPGPLSDVLWALSQHVPVCIISSKDSHFLIRRAPFANTFSCILGIETLVVKRQSGISPEIDKRRLSIDKPILLENAQKLDSLAQKILLEFPHVVVERKLTYDDFLAGITIDWRDRKDWEEPRREIEPYLRQAISKDVQHSKPLGLEAFSSYPFIDVYATRCSKRMGFKYVLSEIKTGLEEGEIIYLGDSENDNPAFKLADITIGIRSDPRLQPRLECDFILDYDKLASFLQRLLRNDLRFSDDAIKMLRLSN